jgi:tetratricopeptide (TPR) repeat protein
MRWQYTYSKGIPIEAQYLYRKALEMSGLGRNDVALNYLRQAVLIAPRYSRAMYEMANCLVQLNRYDEAREKYERAVQIEPQLREMHIKIV